jgi:hypothetical protein
VGIGAAGPGTSFPSGMWNWFAQLLSLQRNLTLDQDINLYYTVSAALFDASIAAWTQKRLVVGFRPLSTVRYIVLVFFGWQMAYMV